MPDPSSYRPVPGSIPEAPGVYRFRDPAGRVIYVGKAKNLRNRLNSYFADTWSLHARTQQMVTTAGSVDWVTVGTEVEALQLEFSWIKEFDPRFNVKYRDDKSYPFLAVTLNEEYPRLQVMRGAKRKGVRYFGPYSHAWAIRETLDLLLRVFPARTCSTGVFKRSGQIGRPCLLGYIGKCSAPCTGQVTPGEHREIVDAFCDFMAGKADPMIHRLEREMNAAAGELDFERAAQLRDKEKQLLGQKAQREKEWKAGDLDVVSEVDDEQIAEVLGNWTGIPVYKLTEEETSRLLRMEDELHKRVIGQEDAVKAVSKAIRRTRAGLKDPKRPSGSFIFAGPSGVGKTELSKALAEFLFGSEDALIQLDMSEFHDRYTVSRLVGAPPGYVGYDEGGQLTEKVRRKPFSVVLFDEIEKAHPDVFNTLLQILEEGRLTDAQGRSVDFRNTVLIMTSNLGTQDLRKATVGFGKADEAVSYEKMKEKVNDALKLHFRPEFLNRIDETIVFHELSKAEVTQIVDLMIKRTSIQLEAQGIGIELTDAAKLLLVERGYDPTLGARPLRRAIQRMIEDPLSERLLYKQFRAGEIVIVDTEPDPDSPKGEDKLVFRSVEGFEPPPVELAEAGPAEA